MSTGADNKTMPITAEYEAGYGRTFGNPTRERGVFVYDKRLGKCVPIDEYAPEESALAVNAPIMVDRFYENTSVPVSDPKTGAVSKVDIGSRKKHREYMKQNGLTTVDDFTQTWAKAEKERERMRKGIFPDARERREEIGRIAYEVEKKNARRG